MLRLCPHSRTPRRKVEVVYVLRILRFFFSYRIYIHSKTSSCFPMITNLFWNGFCWYTLTCVSLKAIIILWVGSVCAYIKDYLQICELLPNVVYPTVDVLHPFHINHYFSFSFQICLRPWCFSFANGYPEAAWCTALSFSPSIPKHFFLGLSCVECSLTKPIWLHPGMQRSYPPVGAVYINEDSVTPQGVSQWVLFLQKKKKKKIQSLCVAWSSKSLALQIDSDGSSFLLALMLEVQIILLHKIHFPLQYKCVKPAGKNLNKYTESMHATH